MSGNRKEKLAKLKESIKKLHDKTVLLEQEQNLISIEVQHLKSTISKIDTTDRVSVEMASQSLVLIDKCIDEFIGINNNDTFDVHDRNLKRMRIYGILKTIEEVNKEFSADDIRSDTDFLRDNQARINQSVDAEINKSKAPMFTKKNIIEGLLLFGIVAAATAAAALLFSNPIGWSIAAGLFAGIVFLAARDTLSYINQKQQAELGLVHYSTAVYTYCKDWWIGAEAEKRAEISNAVIGKLAEDEAVRLTSKSKADFKEAYEKFHPKSVEKPGASSASSGIPDATRSSVPAQPSLAQGVALSRTFLGRKPQPDKQSGFRQLARDRGSESSLSCARRGQSSSGSSDEEKSGEITPSSSSSPSTPTSRAKAAMIKGREQVSSRRMGSGDADAKTGSLSRRARK